MTHSLGIENALHVGFSEPIRDAIWGHVYLTPELKAITRCVPFMRMHRIAQLGPAGLVYPGATHTRAAHSIGVYHITRRLLNKLSKCNVSDYITFTGVRSMLCAALLHDVGHFPYAHSLKQLPLQEHESLSADIIRTGEMRALIENAGGDADMAADIVDCSVSTSLPEVLFYRKLLSGCLDPDKLDYLNRDAHYCGVPYGVQDLDFVLSMLRPNPQRGVDIEAQGITGVESLLFAKYLMYRSVYWHPVVRSADAMIKKALFAGLKDKIIDANELYRLDDAGLFALLQERSDDYPLFKLGNKVKCAELYVKINELTHEYVEKLNLSSMQAISEEENSLSQIYSGLTGTKISSDQVIIDVPDPISFETNLFVLGEDCFFDASSSVFTKKTVSSFKNTLRKVRVFVDPCIAGEIRSVFEH
ncbi:phosphohydrolase [Spirochaetia bacterium]|nr:phosphohydrolase [Spirochaetia bacterium]